MNALGSGTWAGRWSIFLGVCLALIAAGSFVAFSLVASEAGPSGPTARVEARRLATKSPVITLGEPPRDEKPRPGRPRTGSPALGPGDLILGTRVSSGAPSAASKTSKNPQSPQGVGNGSGLEPGRFAPGKTHGGHKGGPPSGHPHKGGPPSGHPHKGGPPSGHPHKGGRKTHSDPNSGPKNAPEPRGEAKGHDKARGKGHDKHPGGH